MLLDCREEDLHATIPTVEDWTGFLLLSSVYCLPYKLSWRKYIYLVPVFPRTQGVQEIDLVAQKKDNTNIYNIEKRQNELPTKPIRWPVNIIQPPDAMDFFVFKWVLLLDLEISNYYDTKKVAE